MTRSIIQQPVFTVVRDHAPLRRLLWVVLALLFIWGLGWVCQLRLLTSEMSIADSLTCPADGSRAVPATNDPNIESSVYSTNQPFDALGQVIQAGFEQDGTEATYIRQCQSFQWYNEPCAEPCVGSPAPATPYCAHQCQCVEPRAITGVDSANCVECGEPTWDMRRPIPWEVFAHGEYLGPARESHLGVYRLRVDDQMEFIYRLTRERTSNEYELTVGDHIRIESMADEDLDRDLVVQPDGTVTLRFLGPIVAAGRTTEYLRELLEDKYKKYYKVPTITVTPTQVNTKLQDLRDTVDSRNGAGGQSRNATVNPDGSIQLPAVGSVSAQGLTLDELKMEIDARYEAVVHGIEVTPVLLQRAPRFIYVVGEVSRPGRYDLVGPTTPIQSIALAEGSLDGANLRNIVVLRRAEDWRLLATKVDVRGALYGHRPIPSDEIWLRDSDIVIVPKTPMKVAADIVDLLFTRTVYAASPLLTDGFFFQQSSL